MNTSKEAEKKSKQPGKLPENDDNLQDLTESEIAAMDNLPAKTDGKKSGIVVTGDNLSDSEFIDKVFAEMDEKKSEDVQELTSNYIDFAEFAEGEERNYLFLGYDTFVDDQGQARPAVRLMDKTRKKFVCASVVTVKALQKVEKTPCPVRIRVNGKVKGKNGSYFDTNVYIL